MIHQTPIAFSCWDNEYSFDIFLQSSNNQRLVASLIFTISHFHYLCLDHLYQVEAHMSCVLFYLACPFNNLPQLGRVTHRYAKLFLYLTEYMAPILMKYILLYLRLEDLMAPIDLHIRTHTLH